MTEELFRNMIDELILNADEDPELKESLKWIDASAKHNGISFYEQCKRILEKQSSEEKAKAWRMTIRWKNI